MQLICLLLLMEEKGQRHDALSGTKHIHIILAQSTQKPSVASYITKEMKSKDRVSRFYSFVVIFRKVLGNNNNFDQRV